MCQFISWWELEGKVYFMTDKDILSSYGRDLLREFKAKDNDPIGHGFIKEYYKLPGGEQRENASFWDGNLPKEIQAALDDFDNNFAWIWLNCLQNDDLRYIIEYAPEAWKAKAWDQLLKQKPDNGDLRYIIAYAPEAWKAKARKILASR